MQFSEIYVEKGEKGITKSGQKYLNKTNSKKNHVP